mgnify:CR=1 FL=1
MFDKIKNFSVSKKSYKYIVVILFLYGCFMTGEYSTLSSYWNNEQKPLLEQVTKELEECRRISNQ